MPTYPIFPSLSRAPDFATSRKIDDGVLSDPKESGYVSTRPRFTRLRRTWKVSWKNLVAEDVRALDKFEVSTVVGGAGAFYMPNLLANGSFEFPSNSGTGQVFSGWTNGVQGGSEAIAVASSGSDGATAALFSSVAGYSLPVGAGNNTHNLGTLTQNISLPGENGDTFQFSASAYTSRGSLPSGVGIDTQPFFTFSDASQIYAPFVSALGAFADYEYSFTAPSGASLIQVGLLTFFNNTTANPVILDNSAKACWDQCGLAITSAAQPYGRMPGTSSPASAVRFTSPLEIKDAKPADGVKRYDASCQVTEV